MESTISIIIRGDSQQYSDLTVNIHPDLTVEDLKNTIEQQHPISPKATLQKLIYNGKVLKNQQQLNAVVKENGVVVHLVYICDSSSQAKPSEQQPTNLRNRAQVREPDNLSNLHGHPAYSQIYNAWMQQYQHQYGYYMQYYYGLENPAGIPFPAQNQVIQEETAAVPEQELPQAEQVPNFEAGLAVDEDEGQDWLDALFALTRILMMLSIIYFYSTAYKFAIAVVLLVLVHLYQAGFFQVNRRAPPPQRNQNDPQDLPDGVPDDNNNSESNSVEDADRPPSLFATVVCFIRSFFSSLIPTGPPGVVN